MADDNDGDGFGAAWTLNPARGYTGVRQIGRGSYGTITLLKDREGGLCVMKAVDITGLTSLQLEDVTREVEVLSSLRHPYIVRFRESFEECGHLAMIMDYAGAGDLHKKVVSARDHDLPIAEDQIVCWITQAALALKYLHQGGVIHRDIKSENLFLEKEEHLRIGDFGLAKKLSNSKNLVEESIVGTPYYLSPEICSKSLYSSASDMWALGCVMYELAALRMPFEAGNLAILMNKIMTGPAPPIPQNCNYSKQLRELCADLLAMSRNQRPRAGEVLLYPLVRTELRRILTEVDGVLAQRRKQAENEGDEGAVSCAADVAELALLGMPSAPALPSARRGGKSPANREPVIPRSISLNHLGGKNANQNEELSAVSKLVPIKAPKLNLPLAVAGARVDGPMPVMSQRDRSAPTSSRAPRSRLRSISPGEEAEAQPPGALPSVKGRRRQGSAHSRPSTASRQPWEQPWEAPKPQRPAVPPLVVASIAPSIGPPSTRSSARRAHSAATLTARLPPDPPAAPPEAPPAPAAEERCPARESVLLQALDSRASSLLPAESLLQDFDGVPNTMQPEALACNTVFEATCEEETLREPVVFESLPKTPSEVRLASSLTPTLGMPLAPVSPPGTSKLASRSKSHSSSELRPLGESKSAAALPSMLATSDDHCPHRESVLLEALLETKGPVTEKSKESQETLSFSVDKAGVKLQRSHSLASGSASHLRASQLAVALEQLPQLPGNGVSPTVQPLAPLQPARVKRSGHSRPKRASMAPLQLERIASANVESASPSSRRCGTATGRTVRRNRSEPSIITAR